MDTIDTNVYASVRFALERAVAHNTALQNIYSTSSGWYLWTVDANDNVSPPLGHNGDGGFALERADWTVDANDNVSPPLGNNGDGGPSPLEPLADDDNLPAIVPALVYIRENDGIGGPSPLEPLADDDNLPAYIRENDGDGGTSPLEPLEEDDDLDDMPALVDIPEDAGWRGGFLDNTLEPLADDDNLPAYIRENDGDGGTSPLEPLEEDDDLDDIPALVDIPEDAGWRGGFLDNAFLSVLSERLMFNATARQVAMQRESMYRGFLDNAFLSVLSERLMFNATASQIYPATARRTRILDGVHRATFQSMQVAMQRESMYRINCDHYTTVAHAA